MTGGLRRRLDRPLPGRGRRGRAPGGHGRGGRGRAGLRRPRCGGRPQGGNTGLVGGAVPAGRRGGAEPAAARRACGDVDAGAGQVTAAPARRIAARAGRGRDAAGWDYGVDFGGPGQRRRSAASVATNAGGMRVLRHGDTRAPARSASRRCWPTARSSATSAGWRRTTPATTSPACCAGARARSASSPRPGCGSCRAPTSGSSPCVGLRRRRRGRGRRRSGCAGGCRRSTRPSCSSPTAWTWCASALGLPRPFAATTPPTCWSSAAATADPTDDLAGAIDALDGVADVAVAADGAAAGRAVALPRGAHRGDQHARPAPQARRDAARRGPRRRSSTRCADGRARRWRPAPARGCSATPPTATSTSTSPASTRTTSAVDDAVLRLVADRGGSRSAPSTASARPSGAGSTSPAARPRSPPCGPSRHALDPARHPQPRTCCFLKAEPDGPRRPVLQVSRRARRAGLETLPVPVRGARRGGSRLGRLEAGEAARARARAARRRRRCARAAGRTYARGTSPQRSSGTPTTATSSTAGCAASAFSTSTAEMFSPPETMRSLRAVDDREVAVGRRRWPRRRCAASRRAARPRSPRARCQ